MADLVDRRRVLRSGCRVRLRRFAMAVTFYQPAFAAVTRWWAPDHVRALTIVTLAGGLASTLFAPLTATLADHLSWRMAYTVLAAVTIPAHALALRAPWPQTPSPSKGHTVQSAKTASRSHPFRMLAVALSLSSFTVSAVVVALVPLLLERGYSTSEAAWATRTGRRRTDPRTHPVRNSRPPHRSHRPHHHTDRTRRPHHRGTRDRPRPLRPPDRSLDRRRDGPRQPHPASSHRDYRPMGHHPLRPPLRPPRGTDHHRIRPRPLRGSRPGDAAGRLPATVRSTGSGLRTRLPSRTPRGSTQHRPRPVAADPARAAALLAGLTTKSAEDVPQGGRIEETHDHSQAARRARLADACAAAAASNSPRSPRRGQPLRCLQPLDGRHVVPQSPVDRLIACWDRQASTRPSSRRPQPRREGGLRRCGGESPQRPRDHSSRPTRCRAGSSRSPTTSPSPRHRNPARTPPRH